MKKCLNIRRYKSLRTSEWALVGSFLLILLSVAGISQIHRRSAPEVPFLPPFHEKIPITFFGAVAKPGKVWVLPGTSLESALKKSRPKRFANLRDLDLQKRIEEPVEIHIEELSEILVCVKGAVLEPVELCLSPGTRICDLKSKIRCTSEADRTFFKKRRLLLDGEVLEIPKVQPAQKEDCGEFGDFL